MEGLDNTTTFQVEGELKNNVIKFKDQEDVLNYIVLKAYTIEYYKKGSVEMKFIFDKTRKTKGVYQIMGNELRFIIHTKELVINTEDLLVKYDLYQDDELVNTNKLLITFKNVEEDN